MTFTNAVTARAQAIYRPEYPYSIRYDILQCIYSDTFVANIIIYQEERVGHLWKCLLTGRSTKSVVNALEDLWNKLQEKISSFLDGRH